VALRKTAVTAATAARECSLSIRLLWPFARIAAANADPELLGAVLRLGIGLSEFANPETRVPHRAVMGLLQQLVDSSGDASIGLRAGCSVESGDFDALEFAARCTADLRGAIGCMTRYMNLLNEAALVTLREEGDRAIWEFRATDGVPQVPAANDFVVSSAITFARMYAEVPEVSLEVHLMHAQPTDPASYERVFGKSVKLGMPHNAWVFPRELLALPMRRADPNVHLAFETRARELAERLRGQQGVAGRAREVVFAHLRAGDASMAAVASAMAMSVATLRRRLEAEGTTHSEILDRVRSDLAMLYLSESRLSVREIAFLLGYSQSRAFHNAFRRWTDGSTPVDYRTKHQK
jgi:AraC-like DNA-binding protein